MTFKIKGGIGCDENWGRLSLDTDLGLKCGRALIKTDRGGVDVNQDGDASGTLPGSRYGFRQVAFIDEQMRSGGFEAFDGDDYIGYYMWATCQAIGGSTLTTTTGK